MCQDRIGSNFVPLTQEFLAHMLGTRRASATVAAGMLQKAGLITYSRGHVNIVDRSPWKAPCCECYAIMQQQDERWREQERPRFVVSFFTAGPAAHRLAAIPAPPAKVTFSPILSHSPARAGHALAYNSGNADQRTGNQDDPGLETVGGPDREWHLPAPPVSGRLGTQRGVPYRTPWTGTATGRDQTHSWRIRRPPESNLSRWEATAKLSHPHLLRLFETGSCQLDKLVLLYVVMEYAEDNLAQILPHRALAPEEVRDLLEPALDALTFIHGKSLVHGRLKPSNVMAAQDQLKISSDSLFRSGDPAGRLGQPSVYDAPEIASGNILPASDTWSLGMTVMEALTQRLPAVEGMTEPLPETVPAPFMGIAHCCLRRDPQRRCTVSDIATRLQAASAGARSSLPRSEYLRRPPSGVICFPSPSWHWERPPC